MKYFEYGDQEVGLKEMIFTVASMVIGIGILTLPRAVASTTQSSDGWISIVVASLAAMGFGWVLGKLASRFGNRNFLEYIAYVATKPVAFVVTIAFCLYYLLFTAFLVRTIATIAKQYLFERTPVEVIALAFLLVVVYAVFGVRAGIIRLNVLFLPLVVVIAIAVLTFTAGLFRPDHLMPMFITGFDGLLGGVRETVFSLLGFDVVLFYVSFMNAPKNAPKAVVFGLLIPSVFYLFIYLFAIGVFSFEVASQIVYPTIELAKEVQIPGEFFERFESLFFVVWIMTIFNTACMGMDIPVSLSGFMTKKMKRSVWIYIYAPAIYFLCMLPKNTSALAQIGNFLSYVGLIVSVFVPALLFLLTKIREGRNHAA